MPDDDRRDRRSNGGRRQPGESSGPVLVAIALGGGLGALARYGISIAAPTGSRDFPWATFGINVAGCLLIGVLMVLVTERWTAHRLVRPFLGVGVLGGFTTFSTYSVDIVQRLTPSAAATALAYLAGTAVAAVLAVAAGVGMARRVFAVQRNSQ